MYNVMQLCAVKCTKLEDSSFYLDIKTNVTEFHSREVPIYMYISVRDHEWQWYAIRVGGVFTWWLPLA